MRRFSERRCSSIRRMVMLGISHHYSSGCSMNVFELFMSLHHSGLFMVDSLNSNKLFVALNVRVNSIRDFMFCIHHVFRCLAWNVFFVDEVGLIRRDRVEHLSMRV